jgi:ABC-type tungstate transport system substrate-binding protein
MASVIQASHTRNQRMTVVLVPTCPFYCIRLLGLSMTRPLRALASLIVGITTVIGMIVYQHYSREPPTDAFTAALTVAATILAWAVTGLE